MTRPVNVVYDDGSCGSVRAFLERELPPGTRFVGPALDGDAPEKVFAEDIAALAGAGALGHYVVITSDTARYAGGFVSNNVIFAAGRDPARTLADVEWVFSDFGRNAKSDDDRLFFTSDTHFFHGNIIKYCDRPWSSGKDAAGTAIVTPEDVARMNDELVRRWNETVGKNDVVYHLGDFSFGNREKAESVFRRLNGRVRLVLGNHDRLKFREYYEIGFDRVYDRNVIIRDFVVLSHAPVQWVKAPMFNCFGHVHSCAAYPTVTECSCCVCVERWGYRPVSFTEICRAAGTV